MSEEKVKKEDNSIVDGKKTAVIKRYFTNRLVSLGLLIIASLFLWFLMVGSEPVPVWLVDSAYANEDNSVVLNNESGDKFTLLINETTVKLDQFLNDDKITSMFTESGTANLVYVTKLRDDGVLLLADVKMVVLMNYIV